MWVLQVLGLLAVLVVDLDGLKCYECSRGPADKKADVLRQHSILHGNDASEKRALDNYHEKCGNLTEDQILPENFIADCGDGSCLQAFLKSDDDLTVVASCTKRNSGYTSMSTNNYRTDVCNGHLCNRFAERSFAISAKFSTFSLIAAVLLGFRC